MYTTSLCHPYFCACYCNSFTERNVRFACLQIYCKSCYKFQICNDLPHLHACKLLILHTWQTRWQMWQWPRSRTSQICCKPRCKLIILQRVCTRANLMQTLNFASDLHIRKSVDYIKLANGLQTCKLVANMKFAIGLHHVLYVRKLVANNKFASDLHIKKCVDYTNYTKPLV